MDGSEQMTQGVELVLFCKGMKEQITTPQPRKEILQGKKKEVSKILSVWEELPRDQLPNCSIRTTGKIQVVLTFKTMRKYPLCLPWSYVLF